MVEVSNTTLTVLVVAALVMVGASIFLHSSGITGFATTDTGYVNLTINQTLAIQVNTGAKTIDFGACAPRAGTSYWCATNDTVQCTNASNNLGNCTNDLSTPQYIELDNVGNIDANITMSSECTAATLIGGTSPLFQFVTTNCNGTAVGSWTSFATSSQNVCTNLSYLGGAMRLYANVTIPFNAVGSTGACTGRQSDITFSATTSP